MTLAAVDLPRAYRLLNHGPVTLVSSAHGEHRNLMAAAWAMPLDFDPPKVAVVIDKATLTRELIEASGVFALNLPCRAQAQATLDVGSISGRDIAHGDKFAHFGLATRPGAALAVPLLEGCVGWLECRVIAEPHNQGRYDLFIGEVIAASADSDVFRDGRWHFEVAPAAKRTLHYVAGGAFYVTGESLNLRD
ncbi:MAG TPA: flavin reductase family protein [Azospira sp.]|nr:flavin reductase family protein [Azospira sp.]